MWWLEKAHDYNSMVKIWARYQKEFNLYKGYDMIVSLSQNSPPEAIPVIIGIPWRWHFIFSYEVLKLSHEVFYPLSLETSKPEGSQTLEKIH